MSKFTKVSHGKILNNINWFLVHPPIHLDYLERNPENGRTDYNHISEDEYKKIVFKEPVNIGIPKLIKEKGEDLDGMRILKDYGIFKKGDLVIVDEPWEDDPQYILEVIPNTTYGSTLRHVLDSIYRGIWGLPSDEKRPITELISNVDIPHGYFEGLKLPTKDQDYYILITEVG